MALALVVSANAANPYVLDGLLSKSWQVMGPCDSFDSIKIMTATTAGPATGTPRYYLADPTFPTNEVDGTYSVIFQWLDDKYIKAVKVSLKIEDGILSAKLFGNKARYVSKSNTFPYDFNNNSYSEFNYVYSDDASGGYNLQKFSVCLNGMSMPSGHYAFRGGDIVPTNWCAFAQCDSFDSIVFPMESMSAGGWAGETQLTTFSLFREEADGTRTAVFQWLDDKFIKAVKVAFKIEDGILFAMTPGSKAMYTSNSNAFPYDFNNNSYSTASLATSATEGGYALTNLTVRVGGMLITGEPGEYATPTPGYGDYTNWTAQVVSEPTANELASAGVRAAPTGYDVYYSSDHGANWTLAASGAETSTNDFDCAYVNDAVMPTKLVWRFRDFKPLTFLVY